MVRKSALFVCILALAAAACSPVRQLTDREFAKLDPQLVKLVRGEPVSESMLDSSVRSDGMKEYGVIIRSDNAEQLRSAGIHTNSVIGDVITARVTVEELCAAARLSSVRSISTGSRNYPQ